MAALVDTVDIPRLQTRFQQLRMIGPREIDMRLLPGANKSGVKSNGRLGANLETAQGDPGADQRLDSLGAATELHHHALDGSGRDTPRRSPPPGMHRRYGPGLVIRQKNREAISSSDTQQAARQVGEQTISRRAVRSLRGTRNDQFVGMNLLQRREAHPV